MLGSGGGCSEMVLKLTEKLSTREGVSSPLNAASTAGGGRERERGGRGRAREGGRERER